MDTNKISSNRSKKIDEVKVLTDKFSRSKSVIFTDYRGIKMAQIETLRKRLRASGAELSVAKNTLLKLSLKDAGYDEIDESNFEGPMATLFAYEDEILPIKTLVAFKKEFDLPEIKAGFFDKKFIDNSEVIKLSLLPSKVELYAKVVGSVASPLYGIVNVLQGNLRGLVVALDQIRAQKS